MQQPAFQPVFDLSSRQTGGGEKQTAKELFHGLYGLK
jgi:hypothetical protein